MLVIPGPGLQANQPALDAFRRAAAEWEAHISNPIRVNVTADLGTFSDPNIIGSTGFGAENLNLDYTTVRDKMVARAIRPGNAILAFLPDSAHLRAIVPTVRLALEQSASSWEDLAAIPRRLTRQRRVPEHPALLHRHDVEGRADHCIVGA